MIDAVSVAMPSSAIMPTQTAMEVLNSIRHISQIEPTAANGTESSTISAWEDFGITPVEAQGCGRPVIALGRGGVLETVVPHPGHPAAGTWPAADAPPTGVLYAEQTVEALAAAVRFFEEHERDFDSQAIRASVVRFDRPRFLTEFRAFVERTLPGR